MDKSYKPLISNTHYLDGSQSSEGVGAGVILPPPLQTIQLKLHQECSAFQAELLAILYATKITMNFPKEHFIIASDCQSALSAIYLYIQDYSTRNLRRFAATPKLLLQMLRNIKHGSTSTTILTGHGYIQADLATVSKEDPTCPHCQDEDQTVDHLLFTCPTFEYQRFQTATLLGITNICPASLENLPRKKSAWQHLINWTSTGIVHKSKKT
ncbi:hypothetical protein LAZ67_20000345 [Cordylochernes scorpioides]|uniref:RNase H type-1 domain-containing protein n=1 Tax=Cordylochernes scorpioides TaxID=51811 RepID=A0ABY6LLN9_9ARAC|nr:hypothetical protein LAZ67_20000345 [Cordylochernes scorpioides]